jgi:hypothetical protein
MPLSLTGLHLFIFFLIIQIIVFSHLSWPLIGSPDFILTLLDSILCLSIKVILLNCKPDNATYLLHYTWEHDARVCKGFHGTVANLVSSPTLCSFLLSFIFILVLGGGTLCHLQKFLLYITYIILYLRAFEIFEFVHEFGTSLPGMAELQYLRKQDLYLYSLILKNSSLEFITG